MLFSLFITHCKLERAILWCLPNSKYLLFTVKGVEILNANAPTLLWVIYFQGHEMPFHLDWNIGGGDEICARQQHLFLSLPLFSLTCTATVLVWELMLALVSASGSPHIWQRCLMKEWSGIRTPTSWRAHEDLISFKLKEYHTKWETLFAEGQYCSSWRFNCECDFTFLWGKEKKQLTDVNGFRSAFSSSDLSNTRVTAPGSRSPNSAFCTGTLQYLLM